MKTCNLCGRKRHLIYFYRHAGMADGRSNRCEDCAKLRQGAERLKRGRSPGPMPSDIPVNSRWLWSREGVERAVMVVRCGMNGMRPTLWLTDGHRNYTSQICHFRKTAHRIEEAAE